MIDSKYTQENTSKLRDKIKRLLIYTLKPILPLFPKRRSTLNMPLNLGCGSKIYEQTINVDYFSVNYGYLRKIDYCFDFTSRFPFSDDTFNGLYTEHVLEHLSFSSVLKALNEAYRVLQTGSLVRIILPDLDRAFEEGTDRVEQLWRIHELTQMYGHVSLWNYELMHSVLSDTGFVNIRKAEYRDSSDSRINHDSEERVKFSFVIECQVIK